MKCFLLFFAFYFPWTFQSIFRKGWFKWLPSVLDICMTNGALLLSAYDRCRKASFPLHSHTGFLREELQCFCIHASFLLLSAKTSVILLQQSNQYSSWQSHRSSELLDKVISVISSRPRKLLSTTKFCIFFFLTCVNNHMHFNFELRRLHHHHNIVMAYMYRRPHLSESKSFKTRTFSLNDCISFFFYLRYYKNYENIYPKLITNLHILYVYPTKLIQH